MQSRRAYVDKASGGRIGYIHLPNTGGEGNRELFKCFYPQVDKEALIIDDRYNGGGFIPDRMIELLEPAACSTTGRAAALSRPRRRRSRTSARRSMLINGYSGSGGDAFPYYFRKRGLGTLIGTRTWGGLIGLSGNPDLMDGGSIAAPAFRFLDTEGQWAVEGVGVAPDIEVDRPARRGRQGARPGLEKAIESCGGAGEEPAAEGDGAGASQGAVSPLPLAPYALTLGRNLLVGAGLGDGRWRNPPSSLRCFGGVGRWLGPGGRWVGSSGRWVGSSDRWVGSSDRWVGSSGRWVGSNGRWVGSSDRWVGSSDRWVGSSGRWVGSSGRWVGSSEPLGRQQWPLGRQQWPLGRQQWPLGWQQWPLGWQQ